jgi:serine protease Do
LAEEDAAAADGKGMNNRYRPAQDAQTHPVPVPPKPQPKSFQISLARLLILALACSLIGGLIGAGLFATFANSSDSPVIYNTEPSGAAVDFTLNLETTGTEVVSEVGPAVVTVVNHLPQRISLFSGPVDSTASGSGVIVSETGYIVTNNHVVDGAQTLSVILADGTELPAELVGVDIYADLAVLQVDGQMPAVAAWGNSDSLKAGEPVIAIGSPLGNFTNTVTMGVVSATGRAIEVDSNYFLEGLIQTDAAINQGNSGGPLLNLTGQVIGINTLIVRGGGSAVAEGLGFAIPSNTARAIADQLIQFGKVARPYLGIRWVWITPGLASRYNLPIDHGIILTEIDPQGPGQDAGLQRGDILLSANGIEFDADHPFQNVLFRFAPGDVVQFEYLRDQTQAEVDIKLGTMPG